MRLTDHIPELNISPTNKILALFSCVLLLLFIHWYFHDASFIPSKYLAIIPAFSTTQNRYKLLCMIMTMPENHRSKALYVVNVWASKCDKFIVASNQSDTSIPTIGLVQKEGRDLLWNKTFATIDHVVEHYARDFDFFYKADDDTYANIANMHSLLTTFNPSDPIILGYVHQRYFKQGYPSGGSGYVMSRQALIQLHRAFHNSESNKCTNDLYRHSEDVLIGACADEAGIPLIHPKDRRGIGLFYSQSPIDGNNLRRSIVSSTTTISLNWPLMSTSQCCSRRMVAVHYIKPREMYLLDELLTRVNSDTSSPSTW